MIDADVDVRLVGGDKSSEGRLELYFNGVWGTVCRSFDINSYYAHVVCRQLGYPEGNHQVLHNYGYQSSEERSRQIWLTGLDCVGAESNIGNCSHNGWGNTPWCIHDYDVGVRCQGNVFSLSS